ncbi:MAG: hypothetical protein HPY69_16070 [Armatimonadetes bacterium]|nr:hypothetical protein [Armatimonadota bacterium]
MTEQADLYAVDANVILRYVLDDDPKLAPRARRIMAVVEAGQVRVQCDPVNLAEVVWVLSSYYGLAPADIAAGLLPLVQAEGFVVPDKPRYLRALALYGSGVHHFGDACAWAAAEADCEGRLFSFDRALARRSGLAVADDAPST